MTRVILGIFLSAILTACGDDSPATEAQNDELNPTAMVLETPPTNNQLPTELLPPG